MLNFPEAAFSNGYMYYPVIALVVILLALIPAQIVKKRYSGRKKLVLEVSIFGVVMAVVIGSIVATLLALSHKNELKAQMSDYFYMEYGVLVENSAGDDMEDILTDKELLNERPMPVTVNDSGRRYPGLLVVEQDLQDPSRYDLSLETDR